MSYFYVDIDTSEEGLQQDQELMEAVETLVETAAVSVWSGILQDVRDLQKLVTTGIEYLFPYIVDYREGTASWREDLEKLLLAMVLILIAVLFLTPWQSNSSRTLSNKTSMRRHSTPVFSFHNDSNSQEDDDHENRGDENNNNHHHDDDEEDDDDDDERYERQTDEERFAHVYSQISTSRYRKLVLPPSCKRVEKPQRTVALPSASPKATATPRVHDDDDPVQRIQTYLQHVRLFLRSILTFDYAGAGWTLLQWLQGIQQHRTKQQQQLPPPLEDDEKSQMTTDDASFNLTPPTTHNRHDNESSSSPSAHQRPIDTEEDSNDLPTNESMHNQDEDNTDTDNDAPTDTNLTRVFDNNHRLASDMSVEYYDSPLDHSSSSDHRTMTTPKRSSQRKTKIAQGEHSNEMEEPGTPLPPVTSRSSYTSDSTPPATNRTNHRETIDVPFQSPGREGFFFETAHTTDSLKEFELQFSLPDKHGYILGDDYLPDPNCTPLLVFVNSRSGPQQGQLLITQLRRLLNPIQVWDLADGSPEPVLESFCVLKNLRILVCGGDGTVSWIVSSLEKLELQRKWPPIAICPLGTGNDLARVHGWGGGYNNESLITILEQISESYISLLDRWEVTIDRKKRKETKTFFNYLGVGADAQAALQVHYLRESRPDWFFSRVVNKAWYGIFGAEDLIKASSVNVRQEITLFADGVEIPLPHDSQGIIVLNIDSYAGGVPLWTHGAKRSSPSLGHFPPPAIFRRTKSLSAMSVGTALASSSSCLDRLDSVDDLASLTEEERTASVTACNRPSSCQDGILDIVSIRGAFHLGQIKVGLSNAERLCQCREVVIKIRNKVAVQVDGEPWRQSACTMRIKRKSAPAVMLHRSLDDGGVETEMSKLLDWAEERSLIDSSVHGILMKEFSRRIESKIRQRREWEAQRNPLLHLKRAIGSTASLPSHSGLSFGLS